MTEPAWCSRCKKHRTEPVRAIDAHAALCPVCKDNDRIEQLELRKAGGWV